MRLARVLTMSLCLLAALSDPTAANWSDDPEHCDDANEVEKGTAACTICAYQRTSQKVRRDIFPALIHINSRMTFIRR
jgi:hypothetical protein